jgi:hypothetical protein
MVINTVYITTYWEETWCMLGENQTASVHISHEINLIDFIDAFDSVDLYFTQSRKQDQVIFTVCEK